MRELENVVYIPYWLLILLLFLSSGAVQYGLIGAVRGVKHWSEERARRRAALASKTSGILLLDDARKERAQ